MWARGAAVVGVVLFAGGQRAMAQDDDCEETAVDFDKSSTNIDLDAQARLNSIAQWAALETGRYILVAPHDASTAAEARIGDVRASAVAQYLVMQGLSPRIVIPVPPDAVTPTQRHALNYREAVIVLSCSGVAP